MSYVKPEDTPIMEGNLVSVLTEVGRYDQARERLAHVLAIHEAAQDRPSVLATKYQLGMLDINQGLAADDLAEEFRGYLAEAQNLHDQDLEALFRTALPYLLEKLGRVDEAWEALEQLEATKTHYLETGFYYSLKGKLLYARGDARGAIEMLHQARDCPVENEWGEDDEAVLALAEKALSSGDLAPLPKP